MTRLKKAEKGLGEYSLWIITTGHDPYYSASSVSCRIIAKNQYLRNASSKRKARYVTDTSICRKNSGVFVGDLEIFNPTRSMNMVPKWQEKNDCGFCREQENDHVIINGKSSAMSSHLWARNLLFCRSAIAGVSLRCESIGWAEAGLQNSHDGASFTDELMHTRDTAC